MEVVKFGIVGIGNMGSAHAKYIGEMSNAVLVAACDIDPKAFDRLPKEGREKIRCFTDLDAFLKEGGMDAVIVSIPHYFHPDVAIRAMQAGKHIIVEKPIAVHKAEALRLIAEGEKHPELVQSMMLNQRTICAHKKIKQLIDTGALGKITRVNWIITDWFRTQRYYDSGDWRASWRGEGGGVLLNQCPHQLDLMQWFFGMPVRVRAAVKLGKYHDIEVEDEVNAYLEYEDGKVGNFIASTGEMPGTNRLEITADNGRLVYENNVLEFIRNEIPTEEYSRTSENAFRKADNWTCRINVQDEEHSADHQHRNILNNVAEAILHGAPLFAPLAEGRFGLELGNAILLSGLKDKTVTLPIDAAEFAAELEKLVATSRYRKKAPVAAAAGDFGGSFGNH